LQHSFKREIYAVPLARNAKQFLKGEHKHLNYFNYSQEELVSFWKNRWLNMRKRDPKVMKEVESFHRENFMIF